jgi:hypothetical protein
MLATALKAKPANLKPGRYVMKGLACSLTLCCCAVSSASGGDSAEMLRERLMFCSQFVIEEPAPAIAKDSINNYGGFIHRTYDCHLLDWNDKSS